VTAAAGGHADLAVSNALGGIAAQTVFLAIADMAYRKANLEHAASSLPNMLQGALLIAMLSLPLLGVAGPQVTLFGVHPVSVVLVAAYVFGMHMVSQVHKRPLWKPHLTAETLLDRADERNKAMSHQGLQWARFVAYGGVVGFSGFVVAKAGLALSAQTGISETMVGLLFTAICTSLPELITSVAAVRQGALTMAVGGIIGGNCFDVLFISFSDIAYREGSIYHAIGTQQIFIIALTLLLTGILLMGLLRREKHGIANIGFESFLILVAYVVAIGILVFHG
jgi:cation:H+ antiporter